MTNIDPLSEAREALRWLLSFPWGRGEGHARSFAGVVLERLDALPAPERVRLDAQFTPSGWGAASAWAYFDAPVARDDVGEDA